MEDVPGPASLLISEEIRSGLDRLSKASFLSIEDLADRILRAHLARVGFLPDVTITPEPVKSAEVKVPAPDPIRQEPSKTPQKAASDGQTQQVSPNASEPLAVKPTAEEVQPAKTTTSDRMVCAFPVRSPRRFFLPDLPSLEDAKVVSAQWGKDRVIDITKPQALLSWALVHFCSNLSNSRTQDVEVIRQHVGITSVIGRHPDRNWFNDHELNISYPKPDLRAAVIGAWRSARAAGARLEIRIEGEGGSSSLLFDPDAVPVAALAKENGLEVAPGTCVRIRYDDTGQIRVFYIMRSADDGFLGKDIEKLPNGSTLARQLIGQEKGDQVELNVPGHHSRSVQVLDAWKPDFQA